MSRILGALCSLFLMVVFTPTLTRADPIVVTSGTITVSGLAGGPHFDLTGDNFHASNAGGDTGNFAPQLGCGPCFAGKTVGVGGSFLGSSLGGGGSITLNGTTVTNPGYGGLFGIGGSSFIVPSVTTDVSITVPFTFAGTLNVCSGSCLINPVLFTVSLVGSGTATVDLTFSGFDNLGRPIFFFHQATFQFEEPVPEPASILLFGGGLALLTAKLKRRFSS